MDRILVFQLSWGCLSNLLDDHLGFTCDGEGSMTCCGRFGVSQVVTVGGRQVDGQATVITETFEAVMLLFCFGELPVCPNPSIGEGGLPSLTRGCGLLNLVFTVVGVTLQGIGLELLEHLEVVQ